MVSSSTSSSLPGVSPLLRRIALGRASAGGTPSTAPIADAQTSPSAASTSRARAREMRRRLEPAPPTHAARRKQADVLLAEEPARGLGGVARLRVIREDDDERATALEEDRGEEERQERLGDARSSGRPDELAET